MATKKWYNLKDLEKKNGPMTFGRFVKAFRESDNISQADYAKMLKLTRANLCDIEKGRRFVSPMLAAKLAKAMGVSEAAMIQLTLEDQLRKGRLHYKVELKSA